MEDHLVMTNMVCLRHFGMYIKCISQKPVSCKKTENAGRLRFEKEGQTDRLRMTICATMDDFRKNRHGRQDAAGRPAGSKSAGERISLLPLFGCFHRISIHGPEGFKGGIIHFPAEGNRIPQGL